MAMSTDEATLADRLHHRQSSFLDHHCPMDDVDDSVGTASEPAEPLTPTSHVSEGAAMSHAFRNDDHVDLLATPRPLTSDMPSKPTLQETPRPVPVSTRSAPIIAPVQPAEQKLRPEKVGLGKRVGSFVRNTLHRNHSSKDGNELVKHSMSPTPDRPSTAKVEPNPSSDKTSAQKPAIGSTLAIDVPKPSRRHSSLLLSRRSDRSSYGSSLPTSSAPGSNLSTPPKNLDVKTQLGRMPKPSSGLSTVEKPRPGITWAASGNVRPSRKQGWSRRRSVSTEQVPRLQKNENKPTAGMLYTFSKPPEEGVGVKARRLSVSLPSDFIIDWCELDKEFKSSSLMPGKRGKILGKGATSEVRIMARRGALSKDEVLVAVKEYRERDRGESEEDYVLKIKSEYSIAKSLHHPNIVETVRLCTNRGRWNHVMEFCTYGEVYSLVERRLFTEGPEGFYSDEDRLCFFKQLLRGIDFLHSHGIAHRDIKLENLLLDRDGRLKISDFGVAEVFSGEHPGLRASGGECGKNMGEVRLSAPGICGSLPYIAPEVLEKNHSYDPRPLDVWSSAVVYLTMTFGGCPWKAAKVEFEYYARFKKGWDQWLKSHVHGYVFDGPGGQPKCGKLFNLIEPPALQRLILKMLHPLPEKRIPICKVLETPYIQSIPCCCPESPEDGQSAAKTRKSMYKHNHIPPKPESKTGKVFAQRFEM